MMTLTYNPNLARVKVDNHTKYQITESCDRHADTQIYRWMYAAKCIISLLQKGFTKNQPLELRLRFENVHNDV